MSGVDDQMRALQAQMDAMTKMMDAMKVEREALDTARAAAVVVGRPPLCVCCGSVCTFVLPRGSRKA